MQKGPRHGTLVDATNAGIRARLVVAAAGEHGDHLVLLLVHGAVRVLAETGLLLLAHVLEGAEKGRGAGVQILRLGHLVEAEAAAEQVGRFRHQVHALANVVNQADVALVVSLVHVGELEGGPGVAAVQNGKQGAVGRHPGYEVLVQRVRVDLPALFEINGADGVQYAGWSLAGWIANLSTVPRVVEEVAGSRLADKPINGSLHCQTKSSQSIHRLHLPAYCGHLGSTYRPNHLSI